MVATGLLACRDITVLGIEAGRRGDWTGVALQALFAAAYVALVAGGCAYMVGRYGYLVRRMAHRKADLCTVTEQFRDRAPDLVFLVPAYKEEPSVVRRTLLSAALQEYPRRRVVLLIDDPLRSRSAADARNLLAMRQLPLELQRTFDQRAAGFEQARREFARNIMRGRYDPCAEAGRLAALHDEAAGWYAAEIARHSGTDASGALLVSGILKPGRDFHRARMAVLLEWARSGKGIESIEAERDHDRLTDLFRVEFTSFERKRYENLSHEPNKAMNLNSYLSLMGGSFREIPGPGGVGVLLVPATTAAANLHVPTAELVLTLDADSILLPDYAARLADIMMRPGNERVAVAQTPYSAFPGAPGSTERIAGAQTDIQYLMHQGFTHYNATYWVGANALLRKAALDDIATQHTERGFTVLKFIQDRTVIEDTESSIDMVDRGWRLYNYPERLAYSATPPDFGSLLIQRQRWANGGLIILPKALRYLFRGPGLRRRVGEAFLRVHYLVSVAAVNIAFLMIMFGPFERNLQVVWIPLSMIPFMGAYARDLVHCGYRWSDYLRVYAMNLILLPVNLGGTFRSIYQLLTGRRAAFGRTPKVTGRTAAPGTYVLAEYLLLGTTIAVGAVHALTRNWLSAGMAAIYAAFLGYGIVRFIGLRASAEDLWGWIRPPATAEDAVVPAVGTSEVPRRRSQVDKIGGPADDNSQSTNGYRRIGDHEIR